VGCYQATARGDVLSPNPRRSPSASSFLWLACLTLLLSGCCTDCPTLPDLPRILYVAADGSGPYKTIGAAVAAAGDGDIIALADGVYRGPGNRDIEFLGKAITLCSVSGRAEACTVDCEGTAEDPHRAFRFHDGEGASTIVQDLTVINGYQSMGGGVLCEHESSPTLRRLVVTECEAGYDGGGLYIASRSRVSVEGCSFVDNLALHGAGGIGCASAAPRIVDCRFEGNNGGFGGAMGIWLPGDGEATVERCAFTGNQGGGGGAIYMQQVAPRVVDCSCSGNEGGFGGAFACAMASPVLVRCTSFADSAWASGSALHCQSGGRPVLVSCTFSHGCGEDAPLVVLVDDCDAVFEKCILSFSANGVSLWCSRDCQPVLQCCDIYGNAGGDWAGCIEDQAGIRGNFSADPLFCDPESGNLYLQTTSPCRPSASDCGLVGALPVGCM
jgi:predicted outer membrane repeat protein